MSCSSCFITMKDKDLLKFKFVLASTSLIFLLIGSKLLFNEWESIHWSFWFWMGLIVYGYVYPTFKLINSKNTQIIFNGFEVAGTIAYVFIILLATIMFLIFYPHISLLFFGLTLMTLSIFRGLKFIASDFDKNSIDPN